MKISVPRVTKTLWQIRLAVILLIINGALAAFSAFTFWMLIPVGVLLGFEALFIFLYVPKFFRSYEIEVRDGAIIVHYGVILKTTRIMPFARLVYLGGYSTPVSRKKGLMGVSVRAARGVLFLPEIEAARAVALFDAVSEGEKR